MFTGIIKETAKIKRSAKINSGLEFEVESSVLIKDIIIGDSVAVNGVCLTVKSFNKNSFKADVSFATLKASTLGLLKAGSFVNLEDAVKLNGKFGGHIVAGHVDNKGKISRIEKKGDYFLFDLCVPKDILPLAAPKGSVAVDGISLTVSRVFKDIISIAVIPFTFKNTNLKYRKQGDFVNLEIDLMARYLANISKYSEVPTSPLKSATDSYKDITDLKNKILEEKLKKYGFKK